MFVRIFRLLSGVTVACLVTALLAAAGVAPAGAQLHEPIGDRINIFSGTPASFPRGTPFHIRHGWLVDSDGIDDDAIGRFRFRLEVDGVSRREDFVQRSVIPGDESGPDRHSLIWVHNFPEGMIGTHTFTGYWQGPCQSLVEAGLAPGPCSKPSALTESSPGPRTVTFQGPTWNAGRDWLGAPNQSNPSPDSFGNPSVWSYLASDGLVHDPARYTPLPHFSAAGNQERWDDPGFMNLFVGHVNGTERIVMHSYGGRAFGETFARSAILGWTSPIDGEVRIRGTVALPGLSICNVGSGIIWSIDKGSGSLESTVLPAGGASSFDLSTAVARGETLYFIHDPGFDSHCDQARLLIEISEV